MRRWGQAFTFLGLLLLAIGFGPVVIGLLFLPGLDPTIPALLTLSVAPLGILSLLAGVVLLAINWFSR